MSPKMSIFGVGPRIALAIAPYLAAVIAVTIAWPDLLRMPMRPSVANTIAVVLGAAFVSFYATSARILLKEFSRGVLVTRGPYAWCQNPLYASFIFFGIPAAAFAARSWLLLSVAVVGCIAASRLVRREESALEAAFGDAYRTYASRVNRLIPLPRLRRGGAETSVHGG
jgi:protein-S-isoprenylcysteine O-methyltransferase Ste14